MSRGAASRRGRPGCARARWSRSQPGQVGGLRRRPELGPRALRDRLLRRQGRSDGGRPVRRRRAAGEGWRASPRQPRGGRRRDARERRSPSWLTSTWAARRRPPGGVTSPRRTSSRTAPTRLEDNVTTETAKPSLDTVAMAAAIKEALPYISRYVGKTVVIKIGGSIHGDGTALEDVVTLARLGVKPVRGARRRPDDHRVAGPDGPGGQVRRRAPLHRRDDPRPGADGADRQGEQRPGGAPRLAGRRGRSGCPGSTAA